MNYVLRMRVGHHRRLAALLRAAVPAESVAFLLCRRAPSAGGVVFLVDDVIDIEPSAYAAQARDIASVAPLAMARIAQQACAGNRVIVMAHLHPMTADGVEFSQADHIGNRRSFAFFHRRVDQPEHVALVWNATVDECAGLVYLKDGRAKALNSAVVVDDDHWREFIPGRQAPKEQFARQAMLLGAAGQHLVGAMKFAVIGLGGTGSLASLALVHHGARRLVLVDDEILAESNLPRIPASAPSDVKLRGKVELARAYARAHAPDIEVAALMQNVEHESVLPFLVGCDVIVVCTDNTTSRAYLNQLAQQYLIPLLDLGVQFSVGDADAVANEIGRINLVRPGTPCLWCSGHISPERLAAESVPKAERAREGSYLRGIDDPQPSMLAFNMEIVGRGMQILVGFVTGLLRQAPDAYEQRSFLKPRGGAMARQVAKLHQAGCPICAGIGCGADREMAIRQRAA
jgi:molybdopterin/thiamine biosynthesis adenylyltransferase